jgi:hypothetical protein
MKQLYTKDLLHLSGEKIKVVIKKTREGTKFAEIASSPSKILICNGWGVYDLISCELTDVDVEDKSIYFMHAWRNKPSDLEDYPEDDDDYFNFFLVEE